ncbi:MAG TPA: hypothetical protein VKY57_12855 [Chitinispirillaceae bacterium]|nr:hypothetical protein [Chitinispirillaceae bacterium]
MKYQFRSLLVSVFLGMPFLVAGEVVIVSSPGAWLTQRSDTIVAKAQIDTAQLEKKEITIKLAQVNNGKKRVVATKTFKVEDNMGEFSLGAINKDIVGGTEFLELNWSVAGSDESGSVGPVGIVKLEEKKDVEDLLAAPVKKRSDIDDVVSKFEKPNKVGNFEFVTAWDTSSLYLIFKKSEEPGSIQFFIDGKNGKKAFLSYPDRIICYTPSKDSIHGFNYKREVRADSLIYTENVWNHEIAIKTAGDKTLIVIPWADAGIIPFEGRKCGLGVFALNSSNKVTSSIPKNAKKDIPGTWTDLVLQK